MGWGIYIKDVFLSRVTKDDLPDAVDSASDDLQYFEEKLLSFVHGIPRDVNIDDSIVLWEDYAPKEVRDLLEDIKDTAIKQHLYQLALEEDREIEEDD